MSTVLTLPQMPLFRQDGREHHGQEVAVQRGVVNTAQRGEVNALKSPLENPQVRQQSVHQPLFR